MSMFIPDESDIAMMPTASAPVDIRAVSASPFSFPFSLRRRSRKAAAMTTGIATFIGAAPTAAATARLPKATCERPSPIIE